jgi:hypothetical protein
MAAIISVTEGTTSWSVEARIVGDHYAIISGNRIIGIVRKEAGGDTWGWFPIQSGCCGLRFTSVEEALRAGVTDAERISH